MDTAKVQPWWRKASPIFKTGAIGLLVVFNSACVGSPVEQTPVEQKTDNAFLVDAWKMKMTRKGADHVTIAYQPLVSSAKKYTGANYTSDGKILRVSLPSCLVDDQCETMVPSEIRNPKGAAFWYEVVIPYKGEKVLVDGNGPVVDELKLSE